MIPRAYSLLALEYRLWYYRMTTRQWDRQGPVMGFAAMQWMNIFSVLMPAARFIPIWLFMSIQCAGGILAFMLTKRIYRANPITPKYASSLKDAVPGIREFPLFYSYLLLTLALFVGGLFMALQIAT